MVLLRRVIGDALRGRRQGQHRTLREVSTAANVSLGYLSEIERGQKEASSELLAAICDALGAQLSELLREVSDTLVLGEQVDGVLDPARRVPSPAGPSRVAPAGAGAVGHRAGPVDRERREGRPTADVPAARPASERSVEPANASAGAAGLPRDEGVSEPMAKASLHTQPSLQLQPGQVLRRLGGADGQVSVSIRRDAPLKTTLRGTRTVRGTGRERDVVCVG